MRSPRLSFANVVSVLALFIALGGTSYAVVKINGSQIKDRSIPATKIKRNSLTATEVREATLAKRARLADRVPQLVVSKPRTPTTKARAADTGTTTVAVTPSLVKASVGESATLLQSGPFSYTLKCEAGPTASIVASTQEADTLVAFPAKPSGDWATGLVDHFGPGHDVYALAPLSGTLQQAIVGLHLLAPSGAALNVGSMLLGTNGLGADCFASAFAVG